MIKRGQTFLHNLPRCYVSVLVSFILFTLISPLQAYSATIDAEQFCGRSASVRGTILDAVSGSSATCDPATETYETNLTSTQLAGIQTLDFRYQDYMTNNFQSGDLRLVGGTDDLRRTSGEFITIVSGAQCVTILGGRMMLKSYAGS